MANNIRVEEFSRQIKRKLGLVTYPATLGDASGVIYEPGKPGYVRVRYRTAAGLSLPPVVRMRAVLPPDPDTAVLVGYDKQGELAVIEGDFDGLLAQGVNPMVMNAADRNVYGYTASSSINIALSHAVSTPDTASTDVAVRSWIYVLDGTWYYFPGERVDLSVSIPAAGLHCLAGLYLKTDQTIEVLVSTDKDLLDPLGLDDVQEIETAKTAGSIPIWFWALGDGQTTITDADSFLDGRQFINVSSGAGTDNNALFLAWRGYR